MMRSIPFFAALLTVSSAAVGSPSWLPSIDLLVIFDTAIFLCTAGLVYVSLVFSYLIGLNQLTWIRSFNSLAHLNRRLRNIQV
uniref:Secreted protein n=1 Tax=Steinernema glaseri TaxID=37863 RepID=A0A1I7ZRV4_9BILA